LRLFVNAHSALSEGHMVKKYEQQDEQCGRQNIAMEYMVAIFLDVFDDLLLSRPNAATRYSDLQ